MSIASPAVTRREGFTIVELLIVIVVIGILAAITIVAYNGVQQRARNAQMIASAKTYVKALTLYATDSGSYPTGASSSYCLGDFGSSTQCWVGPNGNASVDATVDAALSQYLGGTKPKVPPALPVTASDTRAAIRFIPTTFQMNYYLEGTNQSCGAGGTGSNTSTGHTNCTYMLPSPVG